MGTPKAWLPVGGEPMLSRVVRVVADAVGPVVVVAAPGQAVPPLPPGVRVVRDEVEGQGPLGGLAAGMTALAGEADAVYLSSCDVPLLTAGFVKAVVASVARPTPPGPPSLKGRGECDPRASSTSTARGSEFSPLPFREGGPGGVGRASAPFIDNRLHPLAAAYALSALPVVREHLAGERLRMTDLLDRLGARRIEAHELPELDSLRNVNTSDEYESVLRVIATREGHS